MPGGLLLRQCLIRPVVINSKEPSVHYSALLFIHQNNCKEMDNSKIIQAEQSLLRQEVLYKDQEKKYERMKKMKIYSLVSIPLLIIAAFLCNNYQVQGSTSGYSGIYYAEYPYQGLTVVFLFLGLPVAIILAVVGYIKSKKLHGSVHQTTTEIMNLKNELIVLKNS